MSQYPDPNYLLPPNPLAIWALVLGIIALVLSPFIAGGVIGLVAIGLGIFAARRQRGKGMAITGIVVAAVSIMVAMMVGLIALRIYHAAAAAGAWGAPPNQTQGQMVAFEVALDAFERDNDRYPTTAEGLKALTTAPAELKAKWHGPYLNDIPDDPWGHPYSYAFPGAGNPETYDITSNGPDGVRGTKDDISNKTVGP